MEMSSLSEKFDGVLDDKTKAELQKVVSAIITKSVQDTFFPVVEIQLLKNKLAVTPEEASVLTGVPVGTLNNWRCAKKGPEYSKEGSKVVYPVKKLVSWLEATGRKTFAC